MGEGQRQSEISLTLLDCAIVEAISFSDLIFWRIGDRRIDEDIRVETVETDPGVWICVSFHNKSD